MCLTPGCINAAAKILNSIDESVHPCDNFYEFACGNFIKNTYIPDGKLAIDTFSDVSDKIEIQLKTILNEEIQANESKAFTLAKRLNKSCMNRTAVEALGLRPMKEILSSYGGWPAVLGQDWNETEWDWIDTIGKMRTTGLTTNYVLSTSIGPNFKNSSMRTLRVSEINFLLKWKFEILLLGTYFRLINQNLVYLDHYCLTMTKPLKCILILCLILL